MNRRRHVPPQARSVAQLNWKLLPLIVSPESPIGRSPAIGSVDAFGQRIWREKIACSDRFAAIVNRATIWTAQGFMRGAAPERT
jgi:hypothetical protein